MRAGNNTTAATRTSMGVLLALSLAHCFNDMFQSVISAVYPILSLNLGLSLKQIGLISLVYQVFASVFQPAFGVLFDKKQNPYYLSIGTCSTLIGLLILAYSDAVYMVFIAVAFVGLGSSIIHPEASRLTHYASGGRHGLAQSVFQVGGNFGSAIGPLLVVLIVPPDRQNYIAVFAGLAVVSLLTKSPITKWYKQRMGTFAKKGHREVVHRVRLSKKAIYSSLGILLVLIFSKYVYTASLTNFYTFYLGDKFGIPIKQQQLYLFAFLLASAAGTLMGGPIGDRFGRKYVIWFSILGTAPFSMMMPYANLFWTCVLSIIIGLVLSSAFSAILVYAQELLPNRIGLISGLFFGLAFGIAGIAAAVLGWVADVRSIEYVYRFCAYLPLLGLVAVFLPNVKPVRGR